MDASTSVPQPAAPSADSTAPPLDLNTRNLLLVAERLMHALSEGGAFDSFEEHAAERFDAAMTMSERGDPASRRTAYLTLLDLLLAEPSRFRDALTDLHDQLAAAPLPSPADRWPDFAATANAVLDAAERRAPFDTLVVSPLVALSVGHLTTPPVTRWIDGTLYIGASADRFYRVVTIDYDGPHERAFLTTAEHEQWLVLLHELAPRQGA